MTEQEFDVIILGSGPAGLSAALYTARAALKTLVLSGMTIYGQAGLTHLIENYPGFPDGIGGSELGELFQKQAEKFGAKVEYTVAQEVDFSEKEIVVKTDGDDYHAKALIITTGADPKKLGIPGEKAFTGKGVSYCGTCDGWFFKDKELVVVGGGDSALEEALFLTRFATKVRIVHRRDALRAGAILQKRATENPKISFIFDSVVTEIHGDDAVKSVQIKNVKTNELSELSTDGIFIFIGHQPNSALFGQQLKMDEQGYIITDKNYQTSVAGVFAAGEICDPHFRQVITSAGMGAGAAISAVHYIENLT